MEQEPIEFYEQVCHGYHALAKSEPDRFIVIDGAQSADAIEEQIWSLLQSKIQFRNSKM
jgi:thymidylate kinase